jgi:hypothetical protein
VTEFDKVIPPGGVGKVTASFDTTHYSGGVSKSITVRTGDPARIAVVLQLRAQVVAPVAFAPSETPLIRMVAGEPKPTEITVSATDDRPFDVLAVQADPLLDVTVRPAGDAAPGQARPAQKPVATGSSRYLVSITPKPDTPVGEAIRNVTLTTNLPRAGTVLIRAVLVVAARVQVVPERLVVQPSAEPPVVHARIRKRTGDGLEILGVESSDPDFTAAVTPIDAGREYDLTVRYTGKPGRGPVSAQITAKTNEPRQPAIVIPLEGRL